MYSNVMVARFVRLANTIRYFVNAVDCACILHIYFAQWVKYCMNPRQQQECSMTTYKYSPR